MSSKHKLAPRRALSAALAGTLTAAVCTGCFGGAGQGAISAEGTPSAPPRETSIPPAGFEPLVEHHEPAHPPTRRKAATPVRSVLAEGAGTTSSATAAAGSPPADGAGRVSVPWKLATVSAISTGAPTSRLSPTATLQRATKGALRVPEPTGMDGTTMVYPYQPGDIYQLLAAVGKVSTVQLEPGEQLVGPVTAGNAEPWTVDVIDAQVNGQRLQRVLLIPTRENLETDLVLYTDRRQYRLQVLSHGGNSVMGVRWSYPQAAMALPALLPEPELPPPAADKPPSGRRRVAVTELHDAYSIQVVQGNPSWVPRRVWDDGRKTYIQFAESTLHGELPALVLIERGRERVVTPRVRGARYELDRRFKRAELRLGQHPQDIVRLDQL